jgi:hypothetical protein
MFKNLTDFLYQRTGKEALGFYLAYFLLGIILGGIIGAMTVIFTGATSFEEAFNTGLRIGAMTSTVYCFIVSLLLLVQKKLYKNFGYMILVLITGILAALGGALLGLIIPAYFTTRENQE